MKHLSVKGVITRRSLQPKYSLLYLYSTSQIDTTQAPDPNRIKIREKNGRKMGESEETEVKSNNIRIIKVMKKKS